MALKSAHAWTKVTKLLGTGKGVKQLSFQEQIELQYINIVFTFYACPPLNIWLTCLLFNPPSTSSSHLCNVCTELQAHSLLFFS